MSIAGDTIAGFALLVSGLSAWYARQANNRADSFATVPALLVIEGNILSLKNTGEQNITDVRIEYDGRPNYIPVLQPNASVMVCTAENFLLDSAWGRDTLKPITCEFPTGVKWQVTARRIGRQTADFDTHRRRIRS